MGQKIEKEKGLHFTFTITVEQLQHSINILHCSGQKVAHLKLVDGVAQLIGSKTSISLNADATGSCDISLHLAKLKKVLKTYNDKNAIITINQEGVSCMDLKAPLNWL